MIEALIDDAGYSRKGGVGVYKYWKRLLLHLGVFGLIISAIQKGMGRKAKYIVG